MGKTLAECAIEYLNNLEPEAGWIIWYGNLEAIYAIHDMRFPNRNRHPLNVNNAVLSALGRSKAFELGWIKHIGRPARAFTLKPEYRNRKGEE